MQVGLEYQQAVSEMLFVYSLLAGQFCVGYSVVQVLFALSKVVITGKSFEYAIWFEN
jgi:hypothetical protein